MDTGLAFFVYRRPDHTQRVIDSIKANGFRSIYVFQDGLREKDREAHGDEWRRVSEVIRQLEDLPDAHVEIHISDHNKGLANSIVSGIDYVLQRHETVVALEDDIVLSKSYHRYMDQCFETYKDTPRVMAIAGGWPDSVMGDKDYRAHYPYDAYFAYGGSSEAFGTWRDRWKKYRQGTDYAREVVSDPAKCELMLSRGGDWVLRLLRQEAKHPGNLDTWATYWSTLELLEDGVSVIPVDALSVDIGRDGTGTNSKSASSRYDAVMHERDGAWKLPPKDDVRVDLYLMKRLNVMDSCRRSLMPLAFWWMETKRRLFS